MKKLYIAPEVDVLDVTIEKGFAASGGNNPLEIPTPGGNHDWGQGL